MINSRSKRPLKRFGQNFLTNSHYQNKIVSSLKIQNTDCVLEIGPGKGALSEYILSAKPQKFWAVEIDRRWAEQLRNRFAGRIIVLEQDFLEMNIEPLFEQAGRRLKVIGNIPYNITSPILFKLIDCYKQIDSVVLMTQKEVARRITAAPGNKDYGILSVLTQVYAQTEYLFTVKSGNFFPVPAVDSAVIRLRFLSEISGIENEKLFRSIVRAVFNYRRKMLRKSLSGMFDKSIVNSLNSELLEMRPEALTVDDFKRLANDLHTLSGRINT